MTNICKTIILCTLTVLLCLSLIGCGGTPIPSLPVQTDDPSADGTPAMTRATTQTAPATEGAWPETTDNPIQQYDPAFPMTVLVEDDLCTIRSSGVLEIQLANYPEPMKSAAYLISVTNNSSQTIELSYGNLTEEGKITYGSIRGNKIRAGSFSDPKTKPPYRTLLILDPVGPGETIEFYCCALTDPVSYPSATEMVNAVFHLYASNHSGSFWYRDYVLNMPDYEG